MKKNRLMRFCLLTTLFTFYLFNLTAQNHSPVKNFESGTVELEVIEYDLPDIGGYWTGHNDYGDEAFGEKYFFEEPTEVLGIMVNHSGIEGEANRKANYRITQSGTDGYPSTEIVSVEVDVADIPVDESLYFIQFDEPVMLQDTFFVIFDLGDYSHGFLHEKRVAVMHTPDGTRYPDDFDVFGRNVIKWHSHGAPNWKDFRTENFQGVQPAIHFALFPVVMAEPTGVANHHEKNTFTFYPNPVAYDLVLHANALFSSDEMFKVVVFDQQGRVLKEKQLAASNDKVKLNVESLATGAYFISVQTTKGFITQTFLKQ